MVFLSTEKARTWTLGYGFELDKLGLPSRSVPGHYSVRCELPKQLSELVWFCRFVEAMLETRTQCLLWITTVGVWPSSENWHLYYRLKEVYGDHQLFADAPAHLFLEFEREDMVTFLQLGVSFGWDMHLLPAKGAVRVFLSHDEFAEFFVEDLSGRDKIKQEIIRAGFTVIQPKP